MVSELEQDPHFIPRSVALTDDNMIDGSLSHELGVGNDDSNDEWENEEDEEEDESYDDQNITAMEVNLFINLTVKLGDNIIFYHSFLSVLWSFHISRILLLISKFFFLFNRKSWLG